MCHGPRRTRANGYLDAEAAGAARVQWRAAQQSGRWRAGVARGIARQKQPWARLSCFGSFQQVRFRGSRAGKEGATGKGKGAGLSVGWG